MNLHGVFSRNAFLYIKIIWIAHCTLSCMYILEFVLPVPERSFCLVLRQTQDSKTNFKHNQNEINDGSVLCPSTRKLVL